MREHTRLRDIDGTASTGSLKDTSAFGLQYKHLCRFMEQKISLMTRYLSITKTMKEAQMQKNETKLGDLLSERQDCINRINKIDLSVQKVINPVAKECFRVSNDLKDSLDHYLRGIKSLFEQIVPVDAEVMMMVNEERHCIKAELLKISNVRQAAKCYGSKEMRIPIYMDARR